MAKKEKKGSILNVGVTVVKYAKYLANPIVLYILLGLIILLFLAGVAGFFIAIPGSITGWISDKIMDKLGPNPLAYGVENSEVRNLAIQLENMGYDIENYGFVDTIERDSAIDENDENKYKDGIPQRGEIKKVTSKYLTAYLGEEKKIYKLAPYSYSEGSAGTLTEDFYLMERIKELGDATFLFWGGNDAIEFYFNHIGEYKESWSENKKKLYNDGNSIATYYFYYIKGTEVNKLSSEEQKLYNDRKNISNGRINRRIG